MIDKSTTSVFKMSTLISYFYGLSSVQHLQTPKHSITLPAEAPESYKTPGNQSTFRTLSPPPESFPRLTALKL